MAFWIYFLLRKVLRMTIFVDAAVIMSLTSRNIHVSVFFLAIRPRSADGPFEGRLFHNLFEHSDHMILISVSCRRRGKSRIIPCIVHRKRRPSRWGLFPHLSIMHVDETLVVESSVYSDGAHTHPVYYSCWTYFGFTL